jgi:hypothetical protein
VYERLKLFFAGNQNDGTSHSVFLWLDIKKLAQFLASDQINPEQIILGKKFEVEKLYKLVINLIF